MTMTSIDNTTLDYYRRHSPLSSCVDIRNMRLADACGALQPKSVTEIIVADEAVDFYLYNQAVAGVSLCRHRQQPLQQYLPCVQQYYTFGCLAATRIFMYLLYITLREMRHIVGMPPTLFKNDTFEGRGLIETLVSKSADGIDTAIFEYLPWQHNLTLDTALTALGKCYLHGVWGNSYGGTPWAIIVAVLQNFVRGNITPEVLVDTAFTLQHNTASIFNKSYIYSMGSSTLLNTILNAQHAGVIPSYVKHHGSCQQRATLESIRQVLPDLGAGGYVEPPAPPISSSAAWKEGMRNYCKKEYSIGKVTPMGSIVGGAKVVGSYQLGVDVQIPVVRRSVS